jgi:hypothetical protein
MKGQVLKPDKIREILNKKLGKAYNRVLAEKAGKSGAWISRHIAGTLKTMEGRKLIARAVGVKLCQIHPE